MRHTVLVAAFVALTWVALPAAAIDLVAMEMYVHPDEIAPGETVVVDWVGQVEGYGTVGGSFPIGFYLSTDATISTADTLLERITENRAQYPNQLFAGATAVTIPPGTPPGPYYLGVFLDDTNVIAEEDETNNTMSSRLTVTGVQTVPNLVAGPCAVAPSTARPGDEVQFTWRGRNAGAATTIPFEWRVYLSTDPILQPGDTVIQSGTVITGWVNGYDTGDQYVTVPLSASLAPGTYYVGIFLDHSNRVAESNEDDNQCVAELVVTTAAGVTRWLIPAAASSPGVGQSNWKTQLEVVNPTTEARTATLFYVPRGASWPGAAVVGPVALPPMSALYLDDPLLPQSPTTGLLHLSVDAPGVVATSRTYNLAPGGVTYGQGIPAVSLDGAVAPQRLILPMVHSIPGRFRTNLGLVQTSAGEYTVEVTVHTAAGLALASRTFTRSAAFDQITDIFGAMGIQAVVEGGWIVVRLISGSPSSWTCYASVVDEDTGDPTYIAPVSP